MPLRGWLSALRSGRLEPAWEYEAHGIIWRLLPAAGKRFVGEERNTQEKSVSFFCVDQNTGAVHWRNLRLAERWWIGIEAVYDELVLLHEYAMPDLPDHKKIHAVDLTSGRVLWTNNDLHYLFAHKDRVYAAEERYEERLYYELDIANGIPSREVDGAYVSTLRDIAHSRERVQIDLPVPYGGGSGDGDDLGEAIGKLTKGENRIAFIEYLQRHEIIALGYYAAVNADPSEQLMNHHFVIADRSGGRVLRRDVLNARVPSAIPDAFFGIGNYVYAVKGKKVLQAFNLGQG